MIKFRNNYKKRKLETHFLIADSIICYFLDILKTKKMFLIKNKEQVRRKMKI